MPHPTIKTRAAFGTASNSFAPSIFLKIIIPFLAPAALLSVYLESTFRRRDVSLMLNTGAQSVGESTSRKQRGTPGGNQAERKNGTISRARNGAHNGERNDRDRHCVASSLLSSDTTCPCRKNGPCAFSEPPPPARCPFRSSPWCIDRRPRKVSASLPQPRARVSPSPSVSPPFCPRAFSRRQILKSIEFPVGQTAKLPPNNPVVGFPTLRNVDAKYPRTAIPRFIRKKA